MPSAPAPAPSLAPPLRTVSLEHLVARCFGAAAQLCSAPCPDATAYLAVSGRAGPRWLLPARPTEASLRVARSWRPHGRAAALRWRGLIAAWRSGVAARLPGVERIWIAGGALRSAVHLGTPDRRQKAVVFHAPGPSGVASVEKIAIHDEARAAIAHEAAILESLARLRPGLAPEVLEFGPGSFRTAQIDGDLVPPRLDEAIRTLLASLRLDGDLPSGDASLPERLPAFIEHGDFTPWNLRRSDGRLRLLDWEDARIPGLPLQDLIGWHLAVGHIADRRPVVEILRRQEPVLHEFARRIGLDTGTVAPLVRIYLRRRRELARARGDAGYAAALNTALSVFG